MIKKPIYFIQQIFISIMISFIFNELNSVVNIVLRTQTL